jgi:hypothetical protein
MIVTVAIDGFNLGCILQGVVSCMLDINAFFSLIGNVDPTLPCRASTQLSTCLRQQYHISQN